MLLKKQRPNLFGKIEDIQIKSKSQCYEVMADMLTDLSTMKSVNPGTGQMIFKVLKLISWNMKNINYAYHDGKDSVEYADIEENLNEVESLLFKLKEIN